ncbi:MAG TPA: hypothetical protein PKD78_01165 [Saprospiraceae bacterium]|nr:hypothetical protein [Saprospiraceae bacterium]
MNTQGNFILAGTLEDPYRACFIAEYTQQGDLLRYGQFRNPFFPQDKFIAALGVAVLPSGEYLLSGNIGHYFTTKGVFLCRLSQELEVISIHLYGGNIFDANASLALDAHGNALLGGMQHTDLNTKNIICKKNILKIDSAGNQIGEWLYPPENLPPRRGWQVNDMIALPDGGIVGASAIGREKVFANNVDARLNLYPTIFKMNPDQTLAWETPLGNGYWSDTHRMIRVVPAGDGGGYVGTAWVYEVGTEHSPFKSVSLIGKVADNGDSLWTRYLYFWNDSLGDSYYHEVEDLAAAPGGDGYWLCGQLNRQVPGEPLQQGWLLRTDRYGCLSPGCHLVGASDAPLEDRISLYPNPASEHLVVHHAGHAFSKGRFAIVNSQGRVMREWAAPMDDLSTVFDLSGFAAGGYMLQYREGGALKFSKSFLVLAP